MSDLFEKLSALEHEQWAHWMKYLYGKSLFNYRNYIQKNTGYVKAVNMAFEEKDYDRWRKQMHTDYNDLSEKEKDSEREWAKKVLELIKNDIGELCTKGINSDDKDKYFKKILEEIKNGN